MPYTFKSTRGGDKLVDDSNFIYRQERRYGEKVYWKCVETNCKARVHTILDGEVISICKISSEHTHPSNPSLPKMQETISKMKENALKSQVASRSLIGAACGELENEGRSLMPSTSSLSRNIRRWRQKEEKAPPIPRSRIGYEIPEEFTCLQNGDKFLLYDSGVEDENRMLIFGTTEGLHDLEIHKNWACDGTFKVCPEIFYQLYTLHVNIGQACIPRIYGLLPNKTKESYNMFFQKIKDLLELPRPENLMIDFEQASFLSFSDNFPSASVTGCFFHFCKNVYRKVTDIGLKAQYQTDRDFNTKIKCLMALAFILPADIIDAFIEIVDDDDMPQEVVSYFEIHYIGGERGRGPCRRRVPPTLTICLWNMYERTLNQLPNTNNGVEGFHNALQASVTNTHPNLWRLISVLRNEENLSKKKLSDAERGETTVKKKYKDMYKRILNIVRGYDHNEKQHYLRTIAMNLHDF